MTFWQEFWAHFLAIVLGGLKVILLGFLFWYFVRRKLMAKVIGAVMKDIMPIVAEIVGQPIAAKPVACGVSTPDVRKIFGPVYRKDLCGECNGFGRTIKGDQLVVAELCLNCGGYGITPALAVYGADESKKG